MKQQIGFTKATGLGNDFIIIDDRMGGIKFDPGKLAVALCDRHFGIGADGLLILKKSGRADFLMEYYNADGSHGGMCGNGGRSLAMYAHTRGVAGGSMTFEALDHLYHADVTRTGVRLRMKTPADLRAESSIQVAGVSIDGFFVDTGSPHFVIFCNDLNAVDVEMLGRLLRHHEAFQPQGTNVDFVKVLGQKEIAVRTYERGVEAETLACGTGSVAAAFVSHLHRGVQPPVTVGVRSGDALVVELDKTHEIWLEGGVRILFDGECLYDLSSHEISTAH
ncbi:MAG: diaminopimelate epimerase [Bacteroidota bacterium]